MQKVSLLNCANGVSQSIIRALTKKGVEVQVGDIYPSYAGIQNFLFFKDTLSPAQQSLITSDHQIETKSDLKRLLSSSSHLILTTHNYYSNVASKEKITLAGMEALKSLSNVQKAIVVSPLEHLHYSQTSPVNAMQQTVQQGRGYADKTIMVQSELLYGEDASALHTLVSMIVNKKLKTSLFGQKYISPVDSEDFSAGIVKIMESDQLGFNDYVFRGQSTHMINDLISIVEQKVDASLVQKQNMLQKAIWSDEETNVQNMLEHYVINDLNKGVLKDLGIQSKEFGVTMQYKPKKVDAMQGSLQWNLYCA